MFWIILSSFVVFDVLWWWWARRKLAGLRSGRRWQALLSAFMVLMFGGFVALFLTRGFDLRLGLPLPLLTAVYLWHMVVLPATVVLTLLGEGAAGIVRGAKWALGGKPVVTGTDNDDEDALAPLVSPSRRQVMGAMVAAVPPLVTVGMVGTATVRLPKFRIRHMDLALANLPAALDGFKIAHVTDTHVGRFTQGAKLEAIVERTNALNPDLILMTGDLIDFQLKDLPASLEMIKGFKAKHGFYMCEGNHDLIEDRRAFERGVLRAGVPLLLNEQATIRVGRQDVQVLGIPWGRAGLGRRDAGVEQHVATVAQLVRPGAFPILLAHHPHAFDPAALAGIPLTLAGHTHGGQLMLTKEVGPGPMMYRYWSGLYRQKNSALVVSNGVGNWFPLRINAPAEVVEITLRRSESPVA